MGGELTVDSEPGAGSTFEFSLKVGKETAASLSPRNHPDPRYDIFKGVRILLVDPHFVRQVGHSIHSFCFVTWMLD